MQSANFSFMQNSKCEFFPCHETDDSENFNCLFCYCPLYALGTACKGNFVYRDGNIKDCSQCLIPHKRENYAYITMRYEEIVDVVAREDARRKEENK